MVSLICHCVSRVLAIDIATIWFRFISEQFTCCLSGCLTTIICVVISLICFHIDLLGELFRICLDCLCTWESVITNAVWRMDGLCYQILASEDPTTGDFEAVFKWRLSHDVEWLSRNTSHRHRVVEVIPGAVLCSRFLRELTWWLPTKLKILRLIHAANIWANALCLLLLCM